MLEDFAVFILSHGRADNVITYRTLQRSGYTGRVYIIIDNEDRQAERYYQNFGDKVIMFDKAAEAEKTDTGDNFPERNTVLFARNACFDIAERLGVEYFLVLDDDYFNFCYKIDGRYEYVDSTNSTTIKSADYIIFCLLEYYKNMNCAALSIAQGGDYIGGKNNPIHKNINARRKAMNFWVLSTSRRFDFFGRMNDDVNTYVIQGTRGLLFITYPLIAIQQKETQAEFGGLTDMYLDYGTYTKSFYTVMYHPSGVHVSVMGDTRKRLHHAIHWDATVPCIISEDYRRLE